MIKTLLLILFLAPVNASEITKSHCDEVYDVLREEDSYIKEQVAWDVYQRCLNYLN